jgi:hypothetical protein
MRAMLIALMVAVTAQVEAQEFPQFDCGGVFGTDSSHEKLAETFGADNLSHGEIWGDEGTYPMASVIYPEDAKRRLSVVWQDDETRETPLFIMLAGSSEWSVEGLRVGMSIDEVEALNGKVFDLGGFNDMERGGVADWNGGTLTTSIGDCRIDVQFTRDLIGTPVTLDDPLDSEGPYPSDHPSFRALGARIGTITILYPTE